MNNHLNMLPKQAKFDRKCSKMRWRLGIRPRPCWGTYDVPPNPLIVRENPSHHKFLATPLRGAYDAPPDPLIVSLAPRPLRRLKADPPSFFGTNLTLMAYDSHPVMVDSSCASSDVILGLLI